MLRVVEPDIEDWEPLIIGFTCQRSLSICQSGIPNLRQIPVLCLGRVNPQLVIKALQQGADGIFLAGGRCRHCPQAQGISSTLNRMLLMQRLTQFFGLEAERFQVWFSQEALQSAEDYDEDRIAKMMSDIKQLGPNKKLREEI